MLTVDPDDDYDEEVDLAAEEPAPEHAITSPSLNAQRSTPLGHAKKYAA